MNAVYLLHRNSGQKGLVRVTSGPGGTYTLTPLYPYQEQELWDKALSTGTPQWEGIIEWRT